MAVSVHVAVAVEVAASCSLGVLCIAAWGEEERRGEPKLEEDTPWVAGCCMEKSNSGTGTCPEIESAELSSRQLIRQSIFPWARMRV